VVPLKSRRRSRRRSKRQPAVGKLLPAGRTIALLFCALAAAVGLYLIALESSLFAVERVDVKGAPPALDREVQAALQPFRSQSLVGLDRAAVERAVLAIPSVHSVRIDRDFPNTLRVFVVRERPVAVIRRGPEAWLVASSGKVVRRLPLGRALKLPRIWVARAVSVVDGQQVTDEEVQVALRALVPLSRMGHGIGVTSVLAAGRQLTLITHSGIELRFGDATNAPLKLAVAAEILPTLAPPSSGTVVYLDVSVPERPVSGQTLKSQV